MAPESTIQLANPTWTDLTAVQNQVLRICLGAFRTSPTVSLSVEANVPPLNLRRNQSEG